MLERIKRLKKDSSGFTIIEVMIVLAIAGLIMLIVFLAVPALQRSQRNDARTSEASRISAAVTECLANRNGVVASCLTTAAINVTPGTDTQELSAINFVNGGTTAPVSSTTAAGVWFGRLCAADGSASAAGTARQFVVLFTLENNITRCVGDK